MVLIFVFLTECETFMPNEGDVFQFYHDVSQTRSNQNKGINLTFPDYLKIQWIFFFLFGVLSISEAKKQQF